MAKKFYKIISSHHFKIDGNPRFKHLYDSEKGRWIPDPSIAHLLDYEIVSKDVPVTFWQSFWNVLKKVFWTILQIVLVIIAYGAVRGHLEENNKK